MIKRAQHNITVYRGDTPTFRYTLTDQREDGSEVAVDLTNYTITGQVRYSPDGDVWFQLPITKTDAAKGIFEIKFTKQLSETLLPAGGVGPDNAPYDLQIENNGAVFTFMVGNFTITRDITRA
ncbi:hypothetical protein [Edwardsiella tarda]|uniref:hypothetical protein n=1 Tax=Edwardsiella tarda TaxID=636 RepID=UPI00083AE6C0|nr:hypothetical protein [Edwardsiella tarda]